MPYDLLATYLKLPVFALVAGRLGGLLMFQPLLGAISIPVRLRALLVLGLAALMTPLVTLPGDAPANPAAIALAFATEVLIGGLLGLVVMLGFVGVQKGALLVAQEAGLAFGQIVDPNSEDEETVLGVLYLQLAAVVYLTIGGHRALVAACLDMFGTVPLLTPLTSILEGPDLLARMLTLAGHLAFAVAGPALLALFLVNVALGFISRTMPQLNVLVVGFSIKTLVAFLVMAVSLPSAMNAFVGTVATAVTWIRELGS